MNNAMIKAFKQLNGALKRGNKTELKCKKIWLERICLDLPDTIWHGLAMEGIEKVNRALSSQVATTAPRI